MCPADTAGRTMRHPLTAYVTVVRLDTIGVNQMPEDNPEWEIDSIIKFLQKEKIILMEDC
jgi:hypothetical protein